LAAAALANWVIAIAKYHQIKIDNTPEGKFNKLLKEKCE